MRRVASTFAGHFGEHTICPSAAQVTAGLVPLLFDEPALGVKLASEGSGGFPPIGSAVAGLVRLGPATGNRWEPHAQII